MGKLQFGGGAKKPAAPTNTKASAPSKPAPAPAKKTLAPAKKQVAPEPEEEAPAPPSKGKKELAVPKKQELAHRPANGNSGIVGEIEQSDLKMPRLSLVQPSSQLHTDQEFDMGAVVFEKELVVAARDEELNFVVLSLRKVYQQKLGQDSKEMPETFDTIEEVEAAGGTTDWSEEAVDNEQYYRKVAHIVVAFQAPESLDPAELHRFPYEYDGNRYARAVMTVHGRSYTYFAKNVINKALGQLRMKGGIFTGLWTALVKKHTKGENTWFYYDAKLVGVVDDAESFEFFRSLSEDATPEEVGETEEGDD